MSEQYQLFKSDTCGFCYRVRAYVEQLGMDLPLRDINSDADAFREMRRHRCLCPAMAGPSPVAQHKHVRDNKTHRCRI